MKKLMTVALAAFAGGSLFADLPEGYMPVEYVEATGQQYIEKIHTVKTNTTVVIDFAPYKVSTDTAFFARGWNGGFTLNTQKETANNFFYGYGKMNLGPAKIGTEYVATVSQGKATVAEKLSQVSWTATFSQDPKPTGTLQLFGRDTANLSYCRLYGLKIYEGDELVRDYVMCKNDAFIPGLYDLVSNEFFKSTYPNKTKPTHLLAGPDLVQTNVLDIATSFGVDTGTAPACGRLTDLDEGATVSCSAPSTFSDRTCTGYKLYDCSVDRTTGRIALTEESSGSGTSFTYTHGTTMRRLVWQYSATASSTNAYIGVSGGIWDEASHWSKGTVPGATDDVVIDGKSVYLVATNGSTSVKSLTLGKGAFFQITAPAAANPTNYPAVYPSAYKFNVTGAFTIETGATFQPVVDKLTGNPVFVNCTDFVLKDGATVEASHKGYGWVPKAGVDFAALDAKGQIYLELNDAYSYCTGAGTRSGIAGYGAKGTRAGSNYGYPYAPWLPGAPSGVSYLYQGLNGYAPGGGAVVVFASGKQSVAGEIWADGAYRYYNYGSSGGGVWLVGNAFEVYATARINANGWGSSSWDSGSTGGRISLGAGLTANHISNLVTGQAPAQVSLAYGDTLNFINAHTYKGIASTTVVPYDIGSRTENGTRTYTVNTNVETLVAVKGLGTVAGASKIGGLVSVASSGQVTLGVERLKGSADALSHYTASAWRVLDGNTEIASGTGSTATWTPEKKYALLTLEWTIDAITKDPEPEFFTGLPAGSDAAKTFVGADGGSWEDAANWSPSGVPGLSDAVTLAGKTVYATGLVCAKSLAVAADAKLIVGGTGEDVLAETAAAGPKFGLKVVHDCSITGQVAIGGKDLTAPARFTVGGNLTLEGAAVLAVYATRAFRNDFAAIYAAATPVTVGGKLTLNGTSKIVPDSDYRSGASVHFTAGSVEIAEGASFDATDRGWGWSPRRDTDNSPEARGVGYSVDSIVYENYAPGASSGSIGSGHGGFGARYSKYSGRAYGYQYAPFLPGSCGNADVTRGAGAIWIDCGGQFTLNGTLNANGTSYSAKSANSSGGGIWVSAMGFAAGSQAGMLADGGSTPGTGAGAAGGRIALLLRTTAADREALARGETPAELTYTSTIEGVPTVAVAGGAGAYSSGTTPYMAADGTVATVVGNVTVPTVHVTGDPVAAASTGVVYGDLVTSVGATVSFSASEYGIDPEASYIRYTCTGYLVTNATGGVIAQGSGRSASFTVTDSDTYFTWLWGNRQTGMDVILPASCGGSVSFGGTTYTGSFKLWASDGGVIEAVASSGYEFLYWLGDVPGGSERQARLTLPGGTYRSVMPVFRPAAAATTRTWGGGTGSWIDPAKWDGGVIPGLGDTAVIASGVAIVSNYVACANVTVNGTGKLLFGCALVSGKTTVVPTYPTLNVVGCGTDFAFDRIALDVSGTLTVGGTAEVAVGADNQVPYPHVLARDVSLVGSGVLYLTASPRTTTQTYDAGYDTGRGFLTVGNNLTIGDTAQLYLRSDSYSGGSMVCVVSNQFTLAAGAAVNANDGGFWDTLSKTPKALQPKQPASSDGVGASHGGIGNYGGTGNTYDFLYAPRMPGATILHASNMNSTEPGGGVIRIHARQAKIAGALKATTNKSSQYTGSAGGAIWVTTEGNMKLESGAQMTVKGGTTYYGNPAKGGGGGRIALARYLKPEELTALTADGDTLPAGRFADKPGKYVCDYDVFTNRYPDVTVNISGAPAHGANGCGTFYFLDGKTGGFAVIVR